MTFRLGQDQGRVLPNQHQYQWALNQELAPGFELSQLLAENCLTTKQLPKHRDPLSGGRAMLVPAADQNQ
jgi:hypothetical protein